MPSAKGRLGWKMYVGSSGLPKRIVFNHISFITREVQLHHPYILKSLSASQPCASLRPNPQTTPPEAPRLYHSLVVPAYRVLGQQL